MDDTLYPEKEFVLSGFKEVSKYISNEYKIDNEKVFSILKKDFDKGIRKKNFNELLKKLDLKQNILQDLINIYRDHKPDISLYSDAEIVLNKPYKKIKLGIITDGYPQTQKNKIQGLGIENFFDEIIINDIRKENKLETKSFIKMLLKLGTKPNESIYIGDNPLRDFPAAKKVGIHTVRIKRKDGVYSNIKIRKIDRSEYKIKNLLKLLDIIDRIS